MKDKKFFEIVPYAHPLATVISASAESVLASKKPELANSLLRVQYRDDYSISRNNAIYGALRSAASAHSQEVIALIQTRGPEDKDFHLDTVTSVEPEHSKLFSGFGSRVMVRSSSRGGWKK